jgi:transposase-like protein
MKVPSSPAQREEFFAQIKGGASIAAAARQLGVHVSTAYNWVQQEKARKAPPPVRFAQLKPAPTAQSVEVRVSGATVLVRQDFDPVLLRQVIGALTEPQA